MWNVWGTGEVHTGVLWGDLVERDHLENRGVEGMMLLNWSSRSGVGEHGLDFSDSGWG